jgi:hypothetical protein
LALAADFFFAFHLHAILYVTSVVGAVMLL